MKWHHADFAVYLLGWNQGLAETVWLRYGAAVGKRGGLRDEAFV